MQPAQHLDDATSIRHERLLLTIRRTLPRRDRLFLVLHYLHDLEFEGSEEDLADSFAAWMLLRDGDVEDVDALVAAALQYDVWAELYESDTSDGHSTDAARAANYACWIVGAHPERAGELAPVESLRSSRVAGCAAEVEQLEQDWESRVARMAASD